VVARAEGIRARYARCHATLDRIGGLWLLRQGIMNSDRMRNEMRSQRKLILRKATGNWNGTPSDKFVNEHAWVLEHLVTKRIIEKTTEKEYRLV
jgi:hypothetical protein